MRVITIFILAAFLTPLLHVNTPYAYACSCIAPRSVEEELSTSRAVFEGKVTSISTNPMGEKIVQFNVNQYWKGDVKPKTTITTAQDSAACGYNFEANENYLVYANSPEDLTQLNVSLCGRTKLMYDAKEDIKQLGTAQIPTDQPSPAYELADKQINWIEKLVQWFLGLFNQ